jgi:hypothetical protein
MKLSCARGQNAALQRDSIAHLVCAGAYDICMYVLDENQSIWFGVAA